MEQTTKRISFKGQIIHYNSYLKQNQPDRDFTGQSSYANDPTIMLIHGFPETGSIFNAQIADLSCTYNLIVPDLPGSGGSPYNATLQSTTEFADSLKAISDAEKTQQLVLIGHSMGGYIALAFGEKYPEKLSGLGLLHSTAYQDSEEKKANRLNAIQTMERYGGAAFLKSMIPTLFGSDFKEAHPERIQSLIHSGSQFETKTLQQYYLIMHNRTDKTDLFSKLSIPFLLVSGTEDKAAPAGDLIRQATLPDTVLLEILADAGHMGFIEKPTAVNKLIHQFMQLVQTVQVEK